MARRMKSLSPVIELRRFKSDKQIRIKIRSQWAGAFWTFLDFEHAEELAKDINEMINGNLVEVKSAGHLGPDQNCGCRERVRAPDKVKKNGRKQT